jgi:hypothetical protein
LLAQATGREPAYLESHYGQLLKHLNKKGYLGDILPDNIADEQQLSGHNWLLRALIEHYLWKNDDLSKNLADSIVKNLYLPLKGKYKEYPLDINKRSKDGKEAGNLDGNTTGAWRTSTDIGCAFMPLDALSQYYLIFGGKEVGELLDEMFDIFMKIDFIASSMQTHASLSGTRGVINYYKATGRKELLGFAINFSDLYIKNGMSENYANYNWFGRPLWTEPCAIVDSYMVAAELFKLTDNSEYLNTANKIYYNALGFAQRDNGGFGCDCCVGAKDNVLLNQSVYEAFWCCTMRGGEGLSRVMQNIVLYDDNTITLTNYNDGVYKIYDAVINIETDFPYEGKVKIKISGNTKQKKLRLFIPGNVDIKSCNIKINNENTEFTIKDSFICINLNNLILQDINIDIDFLIIPSVSECVGNNTAKGYKALWHGILMLGKKYEDTISAMPEISGLKYLGKGQYSDGSNIYAPINNTINTPKEISEKIKYQLLY